MSDYLALPERTTGATPSIVLVMHMGGVDRSMRDAADQLAAAGFATIVPDLYASFPDAPAPDTADVPAYMPFAQRLSFEIVDPAIRSAAATMRARFPHGRCAIAGFCMGGVMALVRTIGYSNIFDAAAVWYGLNDSVDPAKVELPVVASFGGADPYIPVDKVEAFRDGLTVAHDVKIYPGAGHGFFHKESAFDPAAAADSLERTTTFLREYLV